MLENKLHFIVSKEDTKKIQKKNLTPGEIETFLCEAHLPSIYCLSVRPSYHFIQSRFYTTLKEIHIPLDCDIY